MYVSVYYVNEQAYCIDSRSRMPLWFACEDGREDNVRFLCSITPPQYLLWPDDQGDTPLHRAAVNGHHKAVEILCQWIPKSDDVHTVNAKTYTAAHVAKTSDVLKVRCIPVTVVVYLNIWN